MTATTQQLLEATLHLPALERAELAEQLLCSLDHPDAELDAKWAAEAESRIDAYESGKMKAVPADEVFAET